jgi:serine phosphatase RsbU (regulator of sigma subunit)
MFGFKKKTQVDETKIQSYKDAVEAVEIFMMLFEWEKSRNALFEIKSKEKSSLDQLVKKIDEEDNIQAEHEKAKLMSDYKKKEIQLTKLEHKLDEAEKKYQDASEKEKFKVRFQKIKDELWNLISNKRASDAMGLLQKFLEENTENAVVIKFFNKEKKNIQKHVEKQKQIEEKKFKDNAKMQAMKLIWNSVNLESDETEKKIEKLSGFAKFKARMNFYGRIKDKARKKKLLDEINILIDADTQVQKDLAEEKLENIHKGLTKEISNKNIIWYDLYGKILWSDKISWDTFGFHEGTTKYNFFLWDATGHGIRAGFIVTLLSRLFNENVSKPLDELAMEINNWLKQDLKSRNFITWIFFEVIKNKIDTLKFVWMWHEPMLVYRENTKTVESIIPGGLAGGIRVIKEKSDVKIKDLEMSANDIILMYSDGIIENKNSDGEFYGMERLKLSFEKISAAEKDITKIYEYIVNDVQWFKWGSSFEDDVSVLVIKRDVDKDIISEDSDYLQDITLKKGLTKKQVKKLEWKTKDEVELELEKIKKDKDTDRILKILENLYYTWEILKLKQEAIKYIKEGYIHKKINMYLKKAIDNETKYKVEQKNQKMSSKYIVLTELYKKWDYQTVITEIEEIISQDGNI